MKKPLLEFERCHEQPERAAHGWLQWMRRKRRRGVARGDMALEISVIIPVYNERETIQLILDRVLEAPYEKEILVVDDFSRDGTREFLKTYQHPKARLFFHEKNMGKGRPSAPPSLTPQGRDFSSRTRIWNMTRASMDGWWSRSRRGLPTWSTDRASWRTAPRALLLALCRQPFPDHDFQHDDQPEPHGHGDLLQGVPA